MDRIKESRFTRSSNGIIGGVCQGLGEGLDIDPWAIRLFWILTICLLGSGIVVYLIAWFSLPRRDKLEDYYKKKILGVCLKISEQSTVELPLVRFIALFSLFASFGISILIYLFLYFFMPENKRVTGKAQNY